MSEIAAAAQKNTKTPRQPRQSITLAAAEHFNLPRVEVVVEPLLIPEKILDKRMNETLGHYEFLVKFQHAPMLYNAWLSPKDLHS